MTANRSRSGRMLVMFAFLMVGVSVLIGLSLNLSQVCQQRAHLQVCADAAAFSGAVQQSRGLNKIARLNNQAALVYRTTRIALHCNVYPNHDAGRRAAIAAEVSYRVYNIVNLIRQQKESVEAVQQAKHTAREVTRLNDPQAELETYVPLAWGVGRLIPATGIQQRFGYFFKQATPWGEVILYEPGREVKALVLRKLIERDTIAFTARVKRPFLPWTFRWEREGSAGVKDLRAYATAKPAGGHLWEGSKANAEYRTKLVKTGSVFPLPAIPDAWGTEW